MIAIDPALDFQRPTYESPQAALADGSLPPTVGWKVAQWTEKWLVHAEGDSKGQPVRLAPHQRYMLDRIYEYDPETGRLLHDRVLIMMGRGNSKTEDCARLAIAELAGPARPISSPHVITSAASYDQADHLFGAAKAVIDGPLRDYFDPFDTELRPKEGDGVMERIAARAGTAEGGLPSCVVGDELHEWRNPSQARVYVVQQKALRKRQVPRLGGLFGSLQISISTPGDELQSLLGDLYQHGVRVAKEEVEDPSFLFLCWEAPKLEDEDLDDPAQLEAALRMANPGIGHWLDLGQLVASYQDPTTDRTEFERYNLSRWVTRPKAWIADEQWMARKHESLRLPDDGEPIVIGFKGSYNRGSTALVGWTPDDFGFVIGCWERENRSAEWTVPRREVEETLRAALKRWRVQELVVDPVGWASEVEGWEREFGVAGEEGIVIRFEVQVRQRMAPAVDRFRAAVLDPMSALTHDGSALLARHIKNCNARETPSGTMLELDIKDSPRRIDLALAAILARQRATEAPAESRMPVYLGSI